MKSQKIFGWFLILSVLAFPLGLSIAHSEEILPPPIDVHASIQVLFAPGKKPGEAIAKAIDEAGIEVLVMSYQLTSKPIVESLFRHGIAESMLRSFSTNRLAMQNVSQITRAFSIPREFLFPVIVVILFITTRL